MKRGDMVKVRLKRHFKEQMLLVFVGRVEELRKGWVTLFGKCVRFDPGRPNPVEVDAECRLLSLPRENVSYVRILPPGFDLDDVRIERQDNRWVIKVTGGPDTCLGERL